MEAIALPCYFYKQISIINEKGETVKKQFVAGQMYELTQLLAGALSVDKLDVRSYILKRIDILDKELDTPPSVRRSSRGVASKN